MAVSPVGEAVEVVVIVEIVGRQLLPSLDVNGGPAGEPEPVRGEADRVGGAGVVDDGSDWEQTL